jgi:hypothetical protein
VLVDDPKKPVEIAPAARVVIAAFLLPVYISLLTDIFHKSKSVNTVDLKHRVSLFETSTSIVPYTYEPITEWLGSGQRHVGLFLKDCNDNQPSQ